MHGSSWWLHDISAASHVNSQLHVARQSEAFKACSERHRQHLPAFAAPAADHAHGAAEICCQHRGLLRCSAHVRTETNLDSVEAAYMLAGRDGLAGGAGVGGSGDCQRR